MSSQTQPPVPARSSSILARARRLGAGVLLATAPLAAPATTLTLDYSVAGEYTNSGWFVGAPDETKADGLILPGGFKLWGGDTIKDSQFWRWDEYYQQTVPRYDFTGVAFGWGGRILGPTSSSDQISAPFDFSVAFSHLLGDQYYSNVNVGLKIGYTDQQYTPQQWQTAHPYGSGNYNSTSFSYYNNPGNHQEVGAISVGLADSTEQLYWYALLTVDWTSEFNSSYYWNGYLTLNGDELTVTIPQNSIDVTYVPGTQNPPGGGNTVPDAGSSAMLLGLAVVGLGWIARRR